MQPPLSVPFPGNLYAALRCGEYIRAQHPHIKVAMGGGFPNTELRSLSEPRVFDCADFITLDDGEAPMEQLIAHVQGKIPVEELKRTFTRRNAPRRILTGDDGQEGAIIFINNTACTDYRQGQLEVASDRLLGLIQKGITVAQVARVNRHFTEAGIMVHAYLMYGFPTQTAQETIDSLELVRQMFKAGILQSAFWHQFAMTAHAPVGLQPEAFGVTHHEDHRPGAFANNDIVHHDPVGADHDTFSFGLKKSLFNWMNGIGIDAPLHQWFEHRTPRPSVKPDYIISVLEEAEYATAKPTAKVVFAGAQPRFEIVRKSKKGASWELASLTFESLRGTHSIRVPVAQGEWLAQLLPRITPASPLTMAEVKADYESAGLGDFELFRDNKPVDGLWKAGLWGALTRRLPPQPTTAVIRSAEREISQRIFTHHLQAARQWIPSHCAAKGIWAEARARVSTRIMSSVR